MNRVIAKVGKNSEPTKVALSILYNLKNENDVEVIGIGSEAMVNQVKALCYLRTMMFAEGVELSVTPNFKQIQDNNNITRTAICFLVKIIAENPLNKYEREIKETKVSSTTEAVKVATSIQFSLRSDLEVNVLSLGSEAIVNQVKALCFSELFAKQNGFTLHYQPSIQYVTDNTGRDTTAVCWRVGKI